MFRLGHEQLQATELRTIVAGIDWIPLEVPIVTTKSSHQKLNVG